MTWYPISGEVSVSYARIRGRLRRPLSTSGDTLHQQPRNRGAFSLAVYKWDDRQRARRQRGRRLCKTL